MTILYETVVDKFLIGDNGKLSGAVVKDKNGKLKTITAQGVFEYIPVGIQLHYMVKD